MISGGRRELDGREEKRNIMHRASSMSRTASMKVGYLAEEMYKIIVEHHFRYAPFLDYVVQTIERLVIL